MQETYLVTGSAGFIGSNLVRYLMYNHKCKIVGVDKLETVASMHNVYSNKSHDFYIGDVRDAGFIDRVFQLHRPSKVIHLSSPALYSTSSEVVGLENVLSCAKYFGADSFTFLSTNEVYQPPGCDRMVVEDDVLEPKNVFSVAKLACEYLIPILKLPHTVLRVPEVFGPRQVSGFIPTLVRDLQKMQARMQGEGERVRDLLYVEDLCAAIDFVAANPSNRSFNVSMNNDFTDRELISMIADQMVPQEQRAFVETIKVAPEYTPSIRMDSSAIREEGWKPAKKFRERLKFTTTWYKNNQWVLSNESA